jgi:steroid 5-alpha reductase family enzyme
MSGGRGVANRRAKAFAWVLLAYLVAAAVAFVVGAWSSTAGMSPLATAFAADVAATIAVFCFSFAFGNSSFYDAYWSVAPIPIAIYWGVQPEALDGSFLRQLVVVALVVVWGCRLTYNWARGWSGLDHEDWRYVDIKAATGRLYWPVSFAGIHMMPTLQVFLGCLPLHAALLTGGASFGRLDVVASFVTAGAIWLEARADKELAEFRASSPVPGAILEHGVWAWSRHPNYFGEMSFWWGLWLFGVAAQPSSWWWTMAGAASITLMFRFVSLPLMEKRMAERRPGFAAYRQRSSLVIPRPFG